MGQESANLDKILEVFYEQPEKTFTVRELSTRTGMPKSTVHKYLQQLKEEKLITGNKASDTLLFKTKKHIFTLKR